MSRATKKAVDAVHSHREDGEEAMKRSSKVVPIDSGRNRAGVQVAPNSRAHLGRKSRRRGIKLTNAPKKRAS